VLCVDFNEKFILSGSVDKTVKVWDVKSGTCMHTFRSHDAPGIALADCNSLIHYAVRCLKFDHEKVITGADDRKGEYECLFTGFTFC
jgi:WD40 repeat protein